MNFTLVRLKLYNYIYILLNYFLIEKIVEIDFCYEEKFKKKNYICAVVFPPPLII